MNQRAQIRSQWLQQHFQSQEFSITPLTGGASFRRYFRVNTSSQQMVLMDAPLDTEKPEAYKLVAESFHAANLPAPEIIAYEPEAGFLLITDFGDQILCDHLNNSNADHYYSLALDYLIEIQKLAHIKGQNLQQLDKSFLLNELFWFKEWAIEKFCGNNLTKQQESHCLSCFELLVDAISEQPVVLIHRDYHSRNLMCLPDSTLGIIDFQDAMYGPLTYDAVSLLKDCYIAWPKEQVQQWRDYFYGRLLDEKLIPKISHEKFCYYFTVTGIQRHLKALMTFTRKSLRDNDDSYLKEIPRTLQYLEDCVDIFPKLNSVLPLLESLINQEVDL